MRVTDRHPASQSASHVAVAYTALNTSRSEQYKPDRSSKCTAQIYVRTDFSGRREVVDEILQGHDDLGETDVFPEATVTTVSSQRFQRSEQRNNKQTNRLL